MAVRKTIEIDGTPVAFQASAATPRLYRNLFGRDIFADMDHLMTAIKGQQEGASGHCEGPAARASLAGKLLAVAVIGHVRLRSMVQGDYGTIRACDT